MLTFFIFTLTLILLLFLLSMVWPPDSPWSPWWRTSGKIALVMCKLAKVNDKDFIYDLGSGDGEALITASKMFGARGMGVEIDPSRVWISKLLIRVHGLTDSIEIRRENFFDVDLSKATVIFMFLVPKTLERLKPKLLSELKPGTRIVTFVYRIDLPMIASDSQNEVYVYEIPK